MPRKPPSNRLLLSTNPTATTWMQRFTARKFSGKSAHRTDHSIKEIAFMRKKFKQVDTSGDGALDFTEVSVLIREMPMIGSNFTDRELRQFFGAVDLDHNGELDFDEFVQLMDTIIVLGSGQSPIASASPRSQDQAAYEQRMHAYEVKARKEMLAKRQAKRNGPATPTHRSVGGGFGERSVLQRDARHAPSFPNINTRGEEEKYVDADAYSPVATGRARPRIGGRGARGRPRSGSAGGKRGASNEYGGGTTNCGGVESCAECVLS